MFGSLLTPIFMIGNGTSDAVTDRSNAVTVLKNGNFGIGNTAPPDPLSVIGKASAGIFETNDDNILTIEGSPESTTVVGNVSLTAAATGSDSSVDILLLPFGDTATSGRVGINTTTPKFPLDVNGKGRFHNLRSDVDANAYEVPLQVINANTGDSAAAAIELTTGDNRGRIVSHSDTFGSGEFQ